MKMNIIDLNVTTDINNWILKYNIDIIKFA